MPKIMEAPGLKEGSSKELCILHVHDTVVQHLRVLKEMGHELPNLFIMSMLELKLNSNTMFEWQ